MKLVFLPHVREGIVPTGSAAARAQAAVALRLESPGRTARDVTRVIPLLGPGDIVTIEPRQVLRVTPSPGTRDAEPEFFPTIEFDAPDLPWRYSPAVPDGNRILPWIALVVIEAAPAVTVTQGREGQSPWILRLPADVARRELPDLSDAWAWTHAQVACANASEVASTLANSPDRTLSRLLAPRRLLPFRLYHACVVPAFLSGRITGLGGNPTGDPALVTGLEPAWSTSNVPEELPAYYVWTFRTGEAGDFESLAQRLHAAPLDATIPSTTLHLSLPSGDGSLRVDWEPPLRVRGQRTTTPRRPPAAVRQIQSALAPGSQTRPVLGPAYFGQPWLEERALTPITQWGPELNLTPMFRAAAGLGAEAVRTEQESLVAAASDQLETFRARQREGRRRRLAVTIVNRVKRRLAAAPEEETSRVFAPLAAATQRTASNIGVYTVAGRRIARKEWTAAVSAQLRPQPRPLPPGIADVDLSGVLVEAVVYVPAVPLEPVREIPAPVAPVDTTAIPTGHFSPRFGRPMSEPLAERYPELMLPGAGSIAPDGALLVESDPAFLEAFLVGANQELNYELLWRGLRADARATAFRRFWGHADGSDDIDDIRKWDTASAVGTHVKTGTSMILLVRSELVRRYPSVLVAAVPGAWNVSGVRSDGTRSPVKDPARLVLPAFRGRIGADVLYAGFSRPSLADAIGATTPAGPPGWFFLLSENPGEPRFGLDPSAGTAPVTRATLSWEHLSPAPDRPYAPAASFPAVPDAAFTPQNATAATMANLVRQRPFRAFLHASLLVRLGA
jgi:hypothetical protein